MSEATDATAPARGGTGARDATLDPITFEILSSRLSAINDEAAMTMRQVSGSPVANEAYDMNVGLMNPEGDCIAIGVYISIHALSLQGAVKDIQANYADDVGINPGDVFFSNDPYVGACHQSDVVVVAPIFYEGEIVGWTGSTVHQIDLGGPVEGQVQMTAEDIFGEQQLFPPIKIVDGGVLRKDEERRYLRRTRLPHLTALDLKAMIAGCNVAVERVQALTARYGLDTVRAAIDGITDATEARFRARLRELPDGTWTHRGYIEYQRTVFPVVVEMTKRDDHLVFDFTRSADQAAAVINCTRPACVGATVAAVLPYLCFDMAWSPAGLQRAIEVRTREGTVVHAAWPAGVSKATTTGSFMATISSSVCLARMLAASDRYRDRLMATWMGGLFVEDVFGTDQRGDYFGATVLDAMAGGSGARSYADGLDAGGFLDSPSSIIANVEDYEHTYPILYLYRRIQPDTGGAGRFRGGATVSMMYKPHDVDVIPTKIMHAIGTLQPASTGIDGGYPSSTNQFVIKRDSNIEALLAGGRIPSELEDIDGRLETYDDSIVRTSQGRHDVYRCVAMGGGGFGDPIERDPERVLRDVTNGVVTFAHARERYGVVVDPDALAVDEAATEARRREIREERRATAIPARDAVRVAAGEEGAARG